MYFGAGVSLPLWEYQYVLRSPWLLAIVGVGTAQCIVAAISLGLSALYLWVRYFVLS
jgi:hypothetical protein